jgi:dUTP pyrophosphatase
MKVKFIKLNNDVPTPVQKTEGSAGFDLTANIPQAIGLQPGVPTKIPTGIAIEPEKRDCVALLFSRSGLAEHGITLANSVGVIDSDYRGEILTYLINNSNDVYIVEPGDRVAQLVFLNTVPIELELVESLTPTVRGDGGFGHTGRK